jgi:hypothetical protein
VNLPAFRSPPWIVFFLVAIFLFIYRASAMANPPYWDAILGMFHEAIWLAEHDFNYVKLAREELGYLAGGPRTYFFSWMPGFYALLMNILPEPRQVFIVLHVLNVLYAAATAGVMVAVLRTRVSLPLAIAATLAMCLQPMFLAQSSMIGSDMIMGCLSIWAFAAYLKRRHLSAIILMVVAVLVKPTAALMAFCLAGGFVLFHLKTRKDAWTLCGYLLPAVFFFAWGPLAQRFFFRPDTNPAPGGFFPKGVSKIDYLQEQIGLMFNQIPDVMILLLCVIAVHGVLILLALRPNLLHPLRWRATLQPFEIPVICVVALGGLTLHGILLIAWLPRYLLIIYPALFILLALALKPLPGKASLPLLIALIALFCANHHGRFYQPPILNNGYILERSLEYEVDLALNQQIAQKLHADYADRTVLAHWPQAQLLAHPGFGYVTEPVDLIAVERPALSWYGVPYFGALSIEQRRAEKNVWLDGHNLFGTNLGIRPGLDRQVDVFICKDRTAALWEKVFRSSN